MREQRVQMRQQRGRPRGQQLRHRRELAGPWYLPGGEAARLVHSTTDNPNHNHNNDNNHNHDNHTNSSSGSGGSGSSSSSSSSSSNKPTLGAFA